MKITPKIILTKLFSVITLTISILSLLFLLWLMGLSVINFPENQIFIEENFYIIFNNKILLIGIIIGAILFLANVWLVFKYFKKKKKEPETKFQMAVFQLTFCLMLALLASVLFCSSIESARESARRLSCDGYLTQIGIVLRMYADVYDGQFPHLNGAEGLDYEKTTFSIIRIILFALVAILLRQNRENL